MRWILALGALVFLAPAMGGQDSDFWGFLEPGRVVKPCAPGSAAHRAASAEFERLDATVHGLKSTDPVRPAASAIHTLLKTDCFLLAAETDRIPAPDTAVSLKQWWYDAMGREWLASFLELPRLGEVSNLRPHVIVPADARKTLSLEGRQDHPLSRLLCRLGDDECGAETLGWRMRADAYFDSERRSELPGEETAAPLVQLLDPKTLSRECEARAGAASPSERYQSWRVCLEYARPLQFALPLGRFKAPRSGWFVIAGRRGHYDFCDTARAYDLATGSAFIHDSCSSLALRPDGEVDRVLTNQARRLQVMSGVVPVDNLREAVWMVLLRGEAEQIQLRSEHYALPAGMTREIRVAQTDSRHRSMWMHTGQTSLVWRLILPDGPALAGELTWPNSHDTAESHAVALLDIAEQAFVRRCPPAAPPAGALRRSPRARLLNDVDREAIAELDEDLAAASRGWRKLPPCGSRRGRFDVPHASPH